DLGSLLRRMPEVGLRTTDVVEFRLAGAPVNGLLFDVDTVRFHLSSLRLAHLRLPHLKNIARISTLERKSGSGLRRTRRAEAACLQCVALRARKLLSGRSP